MEWISIKERIPKTAGEYLIKKGNSIKKANFIIDTHPCGVNLYSYGWMYESEPGESGPITHWMPLPEEPKITTVYNEPPRIARVNHEKINGAPSSLKSTHYPEG
jgi:hypothetical protein